MGRASRRTKHYPKRLGEKLRQIRLALGLSQTAMLERLGNPEGILGTSISAYERGLREPPLLVLLEYAQAANIFVDALIDDSLNLPEMPSSRKSEGIKRTSPQKRNH
jgi:transcriptional regulator with XRE-family HTH domain